MTVIETSREAELQKRIDELSDLLRAANQRCEDFDRITDTAIESLDAMTETLKGARVHVQEIEQELRVTKAQCQRSDTQASSFHRTALVLEARLEYAKSVRNQDNLTDEQFERELAAINIDSLLAQRSQPFVARDPSVDVIADFIGKIA